MKIDKEGTCRYLFLTIFAESDEKDLPISIAFVF